jgi:hypothetical protein
MLARRSAATDVGACATRPKGGDADGARIDEYEGQDALGLAAWVRAGEVSPQELLEARSRAVEAPNPRLNAVVIRAFEEGRKAIEAGLPDGPLRGVPWLLKDLHAAWTGVRLHNGSRFFAENVSDYDSELVARYKRAGSCCSGAPHPPSSAHRDHRVDTERRHPQSVAARALGRRIVGRRRGRSRRGIVPAAPRDRWRRIDPRPGVVLRRVRDEADARARAFGPEARRGWSGMSVQARGVAQRARQRGAARRGGGPGARRSLLCSAPARGFLAEVGADPGRLRIALQTRAFNGAEVDPDCVAAARDAAELCRSLGHDVEEAELSVDRELLARATGVIISANLRATLLERGEQLGRAYTADDSSRSRS